MILVVREIKFPRKFLLLRYKTAGITKRVNYYNMQHNRGVLKDRDKEI